jgi:hypothetical protein
MAARATTKLLDVAWHAAGAPPAAEIVARRGTRGQPAQRSFSK